MPRYGGVHLHIAVRAERLDAAHCGCSPRQAWRSAFAAGPRRQHGGQGKRRPCGNQRGDPGGKRSRVVPAVASRVHRRRCCWCGWGMWHSPVKDSGLPVVPVGTPKVQTGWTALFTAVCFGHIDALRELLDRGADIEAKDNVSIPGQADCCHSFTQCWYCRANAWQSGGVARKRCSRVGSGASWGGPFWPKACGSSVKGGSR